MKGTRLACVLALGAASGCFDKLNLGTLPDGGSADAGADAGADGGRDAGADAGCYGPPAGIIAWWDADAVSGGTAYDIVGGHNGTMDGGVALAPGEVGNAFDFGDGGGFVEAPDSPDFYPTTAFTVEAWVNPTDSFRAYQRIVSKQVDNLLDSTFVLGLGSAGGIYFGLFKDDAGQQYIDGQTPLTFGDWNHVAGVWDGTSMRVYLDGVLQSETAFISAPLTTSAVPLRLGRGDTTTYLFAGELDEVTLYSRQLSDAELAAIFAAGRAGKCKPAAFP